MAVLTAAVIVLAFACAGNIVLTLGIVRRLRSQPAPGAVFAPPRLTAGVLVPEFHAQTAGGEQISGSGLLGERYVLGFFSTSCSSCREHAPEFLAYAVTERLDPARVIAVVQGSPEEAAAFAAEYLGPLAVVAEPDGGPVARSLMVSSFPQFYVVAPDGMLASVEPTISRLPSTSRV